MLLKSFYKNKKILVTGGAGFIGSYLCEQLVAYGAQVTILDDFSTGSTRNIAHIQSSIKILKDTVTNLKSCLNATLNQDCVFHLAAIVSVPASNVDPIKCHEVNVTGTINMLEASLKADIKTLFLASSAAVYGDINIKAHENMNCNPESVYGATKLISEIYCKQYLKNYGLKTVIGRYFNVFGNRIDNTVRKDVIGQFKSAMRENKEIIIYGDGSQSRDFITVHDIVEKTLTVTALAEKIEAYVYNMATGKSQTILELFYKLKKEFPQYQLEPVFLPARPGDIMSSEADCSKFDQLINQFNLYHDRMIYSVQNASK